MDLFCADQVGGLGRLRDFILKLIIYYSIGISFFVLSYGTTGFPNFPFEIGCLTLLMLIGIFLLIASLGSIQDLYRSRIIEELNRINEKYYEQYGRIIDIISDGDQKDNEDDLQFASKSIEWLHKERAERERILNNNRTTYILKTGITASASITLTMLTIYEKLADYGIIASILNNK